MTAFDRAFDYLVGDEGVKYTNNPKDSGGPTKYGITLKSYIAYTGRAVGPSTIENLTVPEAKQFYWDQYWTSAKCPDIRKPEIAIAIFDSAVLYGTGTACLLAQDALNDCRKDWDPEIACDGFFGPVSLNALEEISALAFIDAYRLQLLKRIDSVIRINPKNEIFRSGWATRANRLLTLVPGPPLNGDNNTS